MHIETLVRMANDISNFFDGELQGDEAAEAVATHIRRYWVPVMRRDIAAYIEQGPQELEPTAYAAAKKIAADLQKSA